ncbi:MAG: hypothetical protein HQ581_15005, partial [Planctomycetes bacterium]|nr:hypothetical protein [Planctomycetota bacterium]
MSDQQRRLPRLVERLGRLNSLQLDEVERLVARFELTQSRSLKEKESGDKSPQSKEWRLW